MNESRNMKKRHSAFSMKVKTDAMEAITNGLCEQCKVRVVLISPPLILPGSDNNDLTPAGSLQTASRRAGGRCLPSVTREQPIKIRVDLGPHDEAAAGYH